MKPGFNNRRPPKKEDLHKINENITAKEVRVVGENVAVDVYPTAKAIEMAYEQGLDLVEISPNAVPPVCKIVDYKKYLYEQKKKTKRDQSECGKARGEGNSFWTEYGRARYRL